MCYLTDQAQDYLRLLDSRPPMDSKCKCDSCNESFYESEVVKNSSENFCFECIKSKNYIDFYKKECGLDDLEIIEETKNIPSWMKEIT